MYPCPPTKSQGLKSHPLRQPKTKTEIETFSIILQIEKYKNDSYILTIHNLTGLSIPGPLPLTVNSFLPIISDGQETWRMQLLKLILHPFLLAMKSFVTDPSAARSWWSISFKGLLDNSQWCMSSTQWEHTSLQLQSVKTAMLLALPSVKSGWADDPLS